MQVIAKLFTNFYDNQLAIFFYSYFIKLKVCVTLHKQPKPEK